MALLLAALPVGGDRNGAPALIGLSLAIVMFRHHRTISRRACLALPCLHDHKVFMIVEDLSETVWRLREATEIYPLAPDDELRLCQPCRDKTL
jgi:hypothetical protein